MTTDTSKHQSKPTPKDTKPDSTEPATSTKPQDVKTSKHATRYFFVGVAITVFNFGTYSLINYLFLGINPFNMGNDNGNSNFLWLSTFISTTISTIVAYIAHSKITWKERTVTKHSIIRFFIWNALFAVAIGPWLTQLFSLLTPLYEFAFHICEAIHLPFSYEFVLSTGAFVLTAIVTMILNFLFYDRFVFGKSNSSSHSDSPK